MNLKYKAIIGAVLVALTFGLVKFCDRPRVAPTEPGKLAPGERERVEVNGKRVTVIRADKTTTTFAPGKVKVSIGKDGKATVTVQKAGLAHEPGLGVAFTDGQLKMSLDAKLAYYHSMGFHLGLTMGYHDVQSWRDAVGLFRPLGAVSYNLPFDSFVNTSLYAGTELCPQRFVVGLRLAF